MSDPYRIDDASAEPSPARRSPSRRHGSPLRVLWWALLVTSVAGNAVSSLAGWTFPALGLGLVTVLAIVLLIRDALRRRG